MIRVRLFPTIGGQVRGIDGKIYKLPLWWPMRFFMGVSPIFGKKFPDTSIVVHQTFNGIGRADQYVSINLINPHSGDQFWGININIPQAKKIAQEITDLCERLEGVGIK